MHSKAPESIEEAILIMDRGNYKDKIMLLITVNESSIIIRLLTPYSKSMNLLLNAKTYTFSTFLIKPSVFSKITDLKFFKNKSPN
jgi:hypothetical protein